MCPDRIRVFMLRSRRRNGRGDTGHLCPMAPFDRCVVWLTANALVLSGTSSHCINASKSLVCLARGQLVQRWKAWDAETKWHFYADIYLGVGTHQVPGATAITTS